MLDDLVVEANSGHTAQSLIAMVPSTLKREHVSPREFVSRDRKWAIFRKTTPGIKPPFAGTRDAAYRDTRAAWTLKMQIRRSKPHCETHHGMNRHCRVSRCRLRKDVARPRARYRS